MDFTWKHWALKKKEKKEKYAYYDDCHLGSVIFILGKKYFFKKENRLLGPKRSIYEPY